MVVMRVTGSAVKPTRPMSTPERQFTDQIDRTGVRNLRWKIVMGTTDEGGRRTLLDDGEPMSIAQWRGRCDTMELLFPLPCTDCHRPPWLGIAFWATNDGKFRVRYVSDTGFAYLAIVTRPEAEQPTYRSNDGVHCYRLRQNADPEFVSHMLPDCLPLRDIVWNDNALLSLTIDLDCYEDLESMTRSDYGYDRLP